MLQIKNINISYKDNPKSVVYEDFDLEIRRGEFVAIFGPNGCGKSTLLNAVAGITPVDSGTILFNKDLVSSRKIGFVFQDYKSSLFPWLTARQNVAFPLKILGISQKQIEERIRKMLHLYHCDFNLGMYPYQLSGGQQQYVALLRSLAIEPELLLLDEPFSSLDYQTTLSMLMKLGQIWKKTKITTIFVSHEIDDAIFLAQRIIVLGGKPAKILGVFPVSIPYPRRVSIMGSGRFGRIKKNILNTYTKELKGGLSI